MVQNDSKLYAHFGDVVCRYLKRRTRCKHYKGFPLFRTIWYRPRVIQIHFKSASCGDLSPRVPAHFLFLFTDREIELRELRKAVATSQEDHLSLGKELETVKVSFRIIDVISAVASQHVRWRTEREKRSHWNGVYTRAENSPIGSSSTSASFPWSGIWFYSWVILANIGRNIGGVARRMTIQFLHKHLM